ncbi:D-threonine aldolase [Variovorax sp. PBS-H4]|uniref:alanine racemase n=1 Tax=Variovorax sp. PBS-H4 TaxID=434008 RepID=UPI001317968E|nr:alanine racemase [Variovorax sp. PBS-H4]VTU40751.1 D-threonine aldolase [Variovorax sp. PBS-H4]
MQLCTPTLTLDLDAFDRNVARMARTIARGGKHWRPHVKSIRSPALARRLLAAGARGVTCATLDEAKVMVEGGVDDVLVASQVVQALEIQQLLDLNRRARVMVAVDSLAQGLLLARYARHAGLAVPVLIEVEVGLGRAGVTPGPAVVDLARRLAHEGGLHFEGLMAWEGHATRVAAGGARRQAIADAVGLLTESARLCAAASVPPGTVSCGGTGTFETTSTLDGVTEIQAGGGVFGDLRCREDFGIDLEAALGLRASVISRPTPTRIVCNAGWKSLAVHPKPPRPSGLEGVAGMAHAASHLTIDLAGALVRPDIGDCIDLEVGYADATVFLHREIVGLRDLQAEERFTLPDTRPPPAR